MNKKFYFSIGLMATIVINIMFLWEYPLLASAFIIIIGYIKHMIFPIKKELLWFILISFGGAIVEILLVNIGGAWKYENPHILGIPFYMPLFWGTFGTSIIVLYEGFVSEKKRDSIL